MRALLVLVFLAATASAQVADPGVLDRVGNTLGGAADAIGGVVGGATDAVVGVADGAGRAIVGSGAIVADAFAALFVSVGSAVRGAAATVGSVLPALVVVAIARSSDTIAAIGSGIMALVKGYYSLLHPLRGNMPEGAFQAAAATGAVASVGVAGWAGWDLLRRWGGFLGLAGFSRISGDALLEHPLRNQIFDTIRNNPGIHSSALAREVGAGWGTIVHHLQKLEKARLVAARSVNNKKCFFEQGGAVSRADMTVASALKGNTARNIAGFVSHHPMSSQNHLAERLGISPALASFHIRKLVASGVLDRVRDGKAWLLTTTQSFRRVETPTMAPVPVPA